MALRPPRWLPEKGCQWTTNGSNVYYSTGNVGIGTTSPGQKLDVSGKIAITGTQTIYNAGASASFTGSIFLGDGGGSLSHSIGNEGYYNTSAGVTALSALTSGSYNTAVGKSAQAAITSGNQNTVVGSYALALATTATSNTGVGSSALYTATGSFNTALGTQAGYDITSGQYNTIIGYYPTQNVGVTSGSNNILIGNDVRPPSQAGSSQLNIGNLIYATGVATGTTLSTGNVGIGTTSPNQKLEVQADMNSAPTGWGAGQIMISGTTNANKRTVLGFDTTANAGFIQPYINGTGYNNLLLNPAGGNVGIGIASPGAKLDLYTDSHRGTFGARFINSVYSGDTVPSNVQAAVVVAGHYAPNESGYTAGDINTGLYGYVPTGGHGASASAAMLDRPDSNLRMIFMGGNAAGENIYAEKLINTSTGAVMFSIDTSGNVGIGTASPASLLHVASSGNAGITIDTGGSNVAAVYFRHNGSYDSTSWSIATSPANGRIHFYDGTYSQDVYLSQGSTSWAGISDARLKRNIRSYDHVLDKLEKYRSVSFVWNSSGKRDVGVIAQELYKVFPEIVNKGSDDPAENLKAASDHIWAVQYDKLGAFALEAVKELKSEKDKEVQMLKAANDNLRHEIEELRKESRQR